MTSLNDVEAHPRKLKKVFRKWEVPRGRDVCETPRANYSALIKLIWYAWIECGAMISVPSFYIIQLSENHFIGYRGLRRQATFARRKRLRRSRMWSENLLLHDDGEMSKGETEISLRQSPSCGEVRFWPHPLWFFVLFPSQPLRSSHEQHRHFAKIWWSSDEGFYHPRCG